GSKTYYTQLRLDPLCTESADEMLSALLGESPDLASLKRLIIERTVLHGRDVSGNAGGRGDCTNRCNQADKATALRQNSHHRAGGQGGTHRPPVSGRQATFTDSSRYWARIPAVVDSGGARQDR